MVADHSSVTEHTSEDVDGPICVDGGDSLSAISKGKKSKRWDAALEMSSAELMNCFEAILDFDGRAGPVDGGGLTAERRLPRFFGGIVRRLE